MTHPNRSPLRLVAIACTAAALAFGSAATFAQSGIGGSSPTTGTTARGESGSPNAPLVQKDSGSNAATNGKARLTKKTHRANRHHRRHAAHRQDHRDSRGAAMDSRGRADRAAQAAPSPAYQAPAATGPATTSGPAVQTQSGRVDTTGAAPKTGEPSRTPATPATPGR